MVRELAACSLALLASCSITPGPALPPAPEAGQRASMTEWYYSSGIIVPDSAAPRDARGEVRSPSREWLVLANLARRATSFTATFYFEEIAPRRFSGRVEARRSRSFPLHEMPETVPVGAPYGARVQSDGPMLVQPSRGEYEPANPVTAAMSSFIAYPGPLGARETRWAYADGLVLSGGSPLEEREWISILNPAAGGAASVRIRFLRPGDEGEHRLTIPAERVGTANLFRLEAFPHNVLTGVIVESDRPVVVQQVRRAYTRGIPVIASLWATLAHPIGDRQID